MMRQGVPQLLLRAPRQLQLVNVVRRETTRETDRLRRHRGDFQTERLKERACPETPKPHSMSLGGAPRHHNFPIAPYDYSMINARKAAHDSFASRSAQPHPKRTRSVTEGRRLYRLLDPVLSPRPALARRDLCPHTPTVPDT